MTKRKQRFRMTRIEPPAWARQPELSIEGVTVADYAAMQRHRDKLLLVVHKEVDAYLNDPRLVYDDASGFPNRQRMTGTYYIGDECYDGTEDSGIVISVRCRCLEHPIKGMNRQGDYLGLEVWLRCVRKRWSKFEVLDTDSSSI